MLCSIHQKLDFRAEFRFRWFLMASSVSTANSRFGPFELDMRACELRRSGRRVRIQEKPLRVLMALAERPDEVVSRIELRERLWSGDTFVVFEDGLNTAVSKLREVLGDDPQSPRYIETVRGRGYRLLMAVSSISQKNGAFPEGTPEVAPAESDNNRFSGERADSAAISALPPTGIVQSRYLLNSNEREPEESGKLAAQGLAGGTGSQVIGEPQASGNPTNGATSKELAAPALRRVLRWVLYAGAAALCAGGALATAWWLMPVSGPHNIHITQLTTSGSIDFLIKPVTDGARVYYLERAGGHWNLMETSLKGGASQPVAGIGPNTRVMDISPDHETFLLGRFTFRGSRSSLWLLPVQGGNPIRLASIESGEAVWAPDGNHIVYAQDHDLWIVAADGTGARLFATLPGGPNWLVWSPNGKRLRMTIGDENGNSALWELRVDGSHLHRVLSKEQAPGEAQCCGEWTSDGRYFAFTATVRHHPNLWILREPGFGLRRMPQNPVQLTDLPNGAWGAHVTPDGRSVLFYAGRNRSQIVRLDLRMGKFTPVSPEGFSQPDYSRDGKWLIYIDVNNGMLWKASSDGTIQYPLTLPDLYANFPRWSPDGKRIAVNISRDGGPSNVFLIPASGGAPELLLPNRRSYDVDWAPDGKSLVVVHGSREHPGQRALFLVDLATRRETMVPGSTGRFFPHWSGDSRYLAAYGDREPGVAIFSFATHQWQEVLRGTIGYPVWSRDGRYLYFQKILDEGEPIYRYDPRSQVTERVADCGMEPGSGVSRCAFLGLAPDNSPLLDVTRGAYDLYSAELTLPQ